jgi:EAL domain-containing protein (putative c-di-GMP-specific phosphodiesterase class I)
VLHYQPGVNLITRRIVGVEALIRWQHPRHGLLKPAAFIPAAEQCGIILDMGRWVLGEACRQKRLWNDANPSLRNLRICVNLSAHEFASEDICCYVEELLHRHGIEAGELGVEVTETSLMTNLGTAADVLNRLRAMGVALLMDDFGTGYSSLNYLRNFSFDVLKIDRSFIEHIEAGNNAQKIVRVIMALARVLKMEVIAEGIETVEQCSLLTRLGCRYGQGHLLAQAMSAAEMTRLLELPERLLPATFCDEHCGGGMEGLKEIA